jgi:hypothetical protein
MYKQYMSLGADLLPYVVKLPVRQVLTGLFMQLLKTLSLHLKFILDFFHFFFFGGGGEGGGG